VSAARVRAFTRQAEAEAKGDANALILALDRRVRDAWGDFESFPVTIVRREDLLISLSMPYMRYRQTLADYLRIRRPIRTIEWIDRAIVHVSPERVDAPDITSVVVARNGRTIPPVKNALVRMNFMDGNGKTAMLHAGEIHFSVAAFGAGGEVRVTAVSAAGDWFALNLPDDQLQLLK
jgi:hypothetical protein